MRMKIGFIKPNYPFEKRVALFPEQVKRIVNECVVECGFGVNLGFTDEEYEKNGARICQRSEIFRECDVIFSLKLVQPSDYDLIRVGQIIAGWTHPTGSGRKFMEIQAIPKSLVIIDFDNIYPSVYYKTKSFQIPFIKPNFIWENSYIAGKAAVLHAILTYGKMPDSNTKIAILSAGNVAQGAFDVLAKFNPKIRLFNRRTMPLFYETIGEYDIIVSGVEMDTNGKHLLTFEQQKLIKRGCLVIDAAADAGNTFEGLEYTNIGEPIVEKEGGLYYCVNNAPSILFRESSETASIAFEKVFYNRDINDFLGLIKYER